MAKKDNSTTRHAKTGQENYTQDPWKRLPEESTSAYVAFYQYLALGHGRSIAKAYNTYHNKNNKCASGQWHEWSMHYNWIERAKAYDEQVMLNRLYAKQVEVEKAYVTIADNLTDIVKTYINVAAGKETASATRMRAIERILDMAGVTKLLVNGAELGLDQSTGKVVLYLPDNGRDRGNDDDNTPAR